MGCNQGNPSKHKKYDEGVSLFLVYQSSGQKSNNFQGRHHEHDSYIVMSTISELQAGMPALPGVVFRAVTHREEAM
jgi:hypothetical protein